MNTANKPVKQSVSQIIGAAALTVTGPLDESKASWADERATNPAAGSPTDCLIRLAPSDVWWRRAWATYRRTRFMAGLLDHMIATTGDPQLVRSSWTLGSIG